MRWNLVPIFLFYVSYMQENTCTCCHPNWTACFMQIGFPHAHKREKACQQLEDTIRHGTAEADLAVTMVPHLVMCWYQSYTQCWVRCQCPRALLCWSYRHSTRPRCTIAFLVRWAGQAEGLWFGRCSQPSKCSWAWSHVWECVVVMLWSIWRKWCICIFSISIWQHSLRYWTHSLLFSSILQYL